MRFWKSDKSGPATPERRLALTAAEAAAFIDEVFPQVRGEIRIDGLEPMAARMRLLVSDQHLRPGGTVSGPALFMAADVAFYVAVLGMIGRQPLAVTSNLNITFMRRPQPTDVIAEARILKLGRRLASGDVTLYSQGRDEPVALAQTTYALPEAKG
ncbi:MAG: PaaI family thioesterase [Neomegalonema sp.]|nr:PaaI family thioesterase [Neomegalonema sp.]